VENSKNTIVLCKKNGCRLKKNHQGQHKKFPRNIWNFLEEKDKKKINKAGFATPRGGNKGAYQNHVSRSSQVIIPYEKLDTVVLSQFSDGYVIRLFPEQCLDENGKLKKELQSKNVEIGENAFVLYRSHESLTRYPILENWQVRRLIKNGQEVVRRGQGVHDEGDYVYRVPTLSPNPAIEEGFPQGIFAPEYANKETNFLSQLLLVWLIVKTKDSPYQYEGLDHIEKILTDSKIFDLKLMEKMGVISKNVTACPLCKKTIQYEHLHKMLEMEDEDQLANAGQQVFGATRSTEVNLFHIKPLLYSKLEHVPTNLGWGHASCNTKLGQMECTPVDELISSGIELIVNGKDTLGWISQDLKIIRAATGDTWIKISDGNK